MACWPLLRVSLWARCPLGLFFAGHRRLALVAGTSTEAQAGEVRYPPVVASLTADSEASRARRKAIHRASITRAATPSERIRLLCKLQRLKFIVYPLSFAINADISAQHFTKTAFVSGLPPGLDAHPAMDLTELHQLARIALLQEECVLGRHRPTLFRDGRQKAEPFVQNLVQLLLGALSAHNPLLADSRLDLKPAVAYYWCRGNARVQRGHRRGKVDPFRFQIEDQPLHQIRLPKPLPEFVPLESGPSMEAEVPDYPWHPSRIPLFQRQYENRIFTGVKTEDQHCYGHTQFHLVADRLHRRSLILKGLEDQIEVRLRAHGIFSLFAWTAAQALYQGFWADVDVDRPFTSQAIITDGNMFSFFCYQLNTLALDVESDVDNPRRNLCWGTESMPLYKVAEGDQIVDLDEKTFALLINFLLNKPRTDTGVVSSV
uniref:Mitochondrial ribosomal protein S30 n=1 Tax=Eptatretus burgeri TaxID=7764 RepID=A0A8C4R9M7_EPTBU